MIFRRNKPGDSESSTVASAAPGSHPSPSFAKAVERVFREDRPRILDLGPFCGDTVVQLAARGARVQVDRLDPPGPTPPAEPGKPPPRREPVAIEQPDGRFDLVMGWELIDFVPPDRLAELGAELRRITRVGGWILFLSSARKGVERDVLARYRLLPDGSLSREPVAETPRPRWVHPNREIERAMAGLSLQGIHLQRNQMREFLWVRKS